MTVFSLKFVKQCNYYFRISVNKTQKILWLIEMFTNLLIL